MGKKSIEILERVLVGRVVNIVFARALQNEKWDYVEWTEIGFYRIIVRYK